jgi:hypothetical protein
LQGDGVVVLFVFGGEQEGDCAVAGGLEDGLPGFRVGPQLRGIPALELSPAVGRMIEPMAQGIARGDFLEPARQPQLFFLYAARPEAVHQQPRAFLRRGRVIDPPGSDSIHIVPSLGCRRGSKGGGVCEQVPGQPGWLEVLAGSQPESRANFSIVPRLFFDWCSIGARLFLDWRACSSQGPRVEALLGPAA